MFIIVLSNKTTCKINIFQALFHNILSRIVFIFLASLRRHTYLKRADLLPCLSPISLLGSIVVVYYHKNAGYFGKNKCNLSASLTTLTDVSRGQSANLHEVQETFMSCQHCMASSTQCRKFCFYKTNLSSSVLWQSVYFYLQHWAALVAHSGAVNDLSRVTSLWDLS